MLKKLLSLKRLPLLMTILIGISSLTSCKTQAVVAPVVPAYYDYCELDAAIRASDADKAALKKSDISKEFIEKIVNHNDLYTQTCTGN